MKFRKIAEIDLPVRVIWMNNPAVYETMHFTPPISLDTTIEWFHRNQSNNNRVDVVFEDNEGELLAMGGLTTIDYSVRKAEFYLFVNPDKQRQGIGTEATALLCKYAFDVLQLHKVYLYTNASNVGAKRTYEKVGFTLEGIHRDERIAGEQYEDRLYYGLLAKDFLSEDIYRICHQINSLILNEYTVFGSRVMMVRDDIYPQLGGGIKSRKSDYYSVYMMKKGYDGCVTTGGIQSNHNRAIALMCAKNGWRCHIVYHGTRERFEAEKGNALLVRQSGATYEFVDTVDIGPTMDKAILRLKDEGRNPMYIHGGGHDLPGGLALVDAVKELKNTSDLCGYKPKYIFHASGTGSTQAGIIVGLDLVGWSDVKVIGISVARSKERGTKVIEDFANELAAYYGLNKNYAGLVDFNTDYLCGGYEGFTPEMSEWLDKAMEETGLVFDTTYSGKALYGMMDYMKKNDISGNILFWHTGGLMNLMQ